MNNISKLVGNNIKKELKARGITQAEFAEMIGVDERTVRRWVGGDLHSLDTLDEISKILGISIRDILKDNNVMA